MKLRCLRTPVLAFAAAAGLVTSGASGAGGLPTPVPWGGASIDAVRHIEPAALAQTGLSSVVVAPDAGSRGTHRLDGPQGSVPAAAIPPARPAASTAATKSAGDPEHTTFLRLSRAGRDSAPPTAPPFLSV